MKRKPNIESPLFSDFADDEEMSELIELFVAEMPTKVQELEQAFEEGALEELSQLAHQIRDAAPGHGFPSIESAAADLERASQPLTSLEELRLQLDSLITLCNRANMSF